MSIAPDQREWGRLDVIGLPPTPLSGDREQLLHRLADLTGLAISGARARRRLEIEAMTDALTGLHNQRAFRRRLSDEISRAARYGRPLSLVLIDLDAFKAINDVDGHLTGDLVLAEVARRILSSVRIEGLVARLGGDEMAILLPECDAAGAYSVAERVRETGSAPADRDTRPCDDLDRQRRARTGWPRGGHDQTGRRGALLGQADGRRPECRLLASDRDGPDAQP